jgi:hypothetical protein
MGMGEKLGKNGESDGKRSSPLREAASALSKDKVREQKNKSCAGPG